MARFAGALVCDAARRPRGSPRVPPRALGDSKGQHNSRL